MKLIDVGICLIDAQVNSFFQRSIPLNDTHTNDNQNDFGYQPECAVELNSLTDHSSVGSTLESHTRLSWD